MIVSIVLSLLTLKSNRNNINTMKPLFYFTVLLIILTVLSSCKKDPKQKPQPDVVSFNSVKIGNKEYATTKIGTQYWTIVNFDAQGGVNYSGTIARPEYGNYYTYNEMKALILPEGWRVPTMEDYQALMKANDIDPSEKVTALAKKLTSKTHWLHVNGTNTSGFNAYPAGYCFNNSNAIDGDIAEFWVSDGKTFSIMEAANTDALRITFYAGGDNPAAGYRFNVRLVRD